MSALLSIVTVLICALVVGWTIVRRRHMSERCRHYLATIELWQPQGVMDPAAPGSQSRENLRRILGAAVTRRW